jgi:hypothetical protein
MLWVLWQVVHELSSEEAFEKVYEETGMSLPILRRIAHLESWSWLFMHIHPATVALSVTTRSLGYGKQPERLDARS